jgi:hypothetical protein
MPDETTQRPLRGCDVCGRVDDHPRHVQVGGTAGPVIRHHDCCASRGCPTCTQTEAENAGRRGQDLIDHLAATREASDG